MSDKTPIDSHEKEAALAELFGVISERMQRGDVIDLESIAQQFPTFAAELRQLLPTMTALNELATAPSDAGQSVDLANVSDHILLTGNGAADTPTLGDFRLIREIGRGGMGIVYEAEQISLKRRVAVKVLPLAGMLDKRALARFQNEARAAATLFHPNIVPVFFVGSERSVHFYAMQLIEGTSLAEVIGELRTKPETGMQKAEQSEDDPRVPFSTLGSNDTVAAALSTARDKNPRDYFRRVAEIGIQIAASLQHAHDSGILHRDIKPGNVLLDEEGKAWLTDFGLARLEADASLTATGDFLGTLRYMSPEQVLDNRTVDGRTDIHSLGATLYEAIAYSPARDATSREALLKQIADGRVKPLRSVASSCPTDLETIVHKALEFNPDDRYESAAEMADDLQRHIQYRPIKARRQRRFAKIVRWARRNPVLAKVSACALLLLFTLAVGGPIVAVKQYEHARRMERLARDVTDERDRAHASLDLAQESLDELYETLPQDPQVGALRSSQHKNLIARIVELHLRLAKASEYDPQDSDRVRAAYDRLARIYGVLGDEKATEEFLQKSLAVDEAHLANSPNDAVRRFETISKYLNYGLVSAEQLQWGDAAQAMVFANKHLQSVTEETPRTEATKKASIASVQLIQAIMAGVQKDYVTSELHIRKALEDAQELTLAHGQVFEPLANTCLLQLIEVLMQQNEYSGARNIASKKLKHTLALVEGKHRSLEQHRALIVLLHELLGKCELGTHRPQAAEEHYRRALALRRSKLPNGVLPIIHYVAREFEEHSEEHYSPAQLFNYARCQLGLGRALRKLGRGIESEQLLGEVWYATTRAARDWPKDHSFALLQAQCMSEIAKLHHDVRPNEGRLALQLAVAAWQRTLRQFPSLRLLHDDAIGKLLDEFPWPNVPNYDADFDTLCGEFVENSVFGHRMRGHVYFCAGYWDVAKLHFEKSATLSPNDQAYDWLRLAIAEHLLGDFEVAAKLYERACKATTGDEDVAESIKPTFRRAAVLLGKLPPRDGAKVEFINIGRLSLHLRASALSGDGSTVLVNEHGGPGYRWSREVGLRKLPNTAGRQSNTPQAVSHDGSVIVGELWDPFPKAAYRWTADSGIELLGNPPGYRNSHARAVSADGRVIAGYSRSDRRAGENSKTQAWLWTASDGFFLLDDEATSIPSAISADGRAVVGSPSFHWTYKSGATLIMGLGDDQSVSPRAMSADGRTVVGNGLLPTGHAGGAFVWTKENGIRAIGVLNDYPTHQHSDVRAVSADGSIVVGNSSVGTHPYQDDRAIVWVEIHGARELEQVLASEYGLNETHPWGLGMATAISADRRVIAGTSREGRARGYTPSEAWVVYLDRPIGPPSTK